MSTRVAAPALGACLAAVAAAPAAADELSPDALLARYQPVTVLSQGEHFAPTSVDDFLADAALTQGVGDGTFEPAAMPPAGLPVHGEGWRLDHRCSASGGPLSTVQCYDPAAQGPSVVYGRYEVIAGYGVG